MAKIVCKICGAEEDSSHYCPETKRSLEFNEMCFTCLHWAQQALLDVSERGEHGWALERLKYAEAIVGQFRQYMEK